MKKIATLMLVTMACLCATGQEYMPGHLLVKFNPNMRPVYTQGSTKFNMPAADALNERYHCTNIHPIRKQAGVYLLEFDKEAPVAELVKAYQNTELFEYAEPDYIAHAGAQPPNDGQFGRQWGLYNDGSFTDATAKAGADIDMLHAWDVEDGDTSIIVAVMDSGIKTDHPDFAGRIWRNYGEVPGNGVDDDNNGYIDDTLGWCFAYGGANVADDNGHGTHVSGIIGANVNNNTGYAGVDQHCKLMVCKTADNNGFFAYSWLTEGIYYAIDMGARVMNISAGGATPSNIVADALDAALAKEMVVCVAMMNNGSSSPFFPATHPGVIAVGATGPYDSTMKFSNYGNHISVVAPGGYIYGLSNTNDTSTTTWYHGTSQATPHVAGIAALLLAQNKNRTAADVKGLIERNAEDMVGSARDVPGWDKYYGNGRVNAWRVLTNAAAAIQEVHASTLSVFPNPAQDVVYITTTGNEAQVSVCNMQGTVVYSARVKNKLHAIKLDGLARGSYMVTLHDAGSVETVKLQVQ